MLRKSVAAANIMAMSVLLPVCGATAQTFPTKTLRIVTSGVGGSNDFISRLLASEMAGPLGQSVIVENRSSGVVPAETVARSAPDGHTMLLMGSALWIGPLFQSMPYDALRDFAPITLVSAEPNVLVVPASLPVNSVQELVAYAKARPGALNYASTSIGGSMHLAAELLKSLAGVNVVRVNYSGGSQARSEVISGQVQMAIIGTDSAMPHVKAGRLKALGVSGLKPSALAPGVSPIASTLPGYEVVGLTAVVAPAGTPASAVNQLNKEIGRVLTKPDTRERLLSANQEIAGGPPEVLATTMKSDVAKWSKLIKDAGLKAQ